MPKLDLTTLAPRTGSIYPGKLSDEMAGRSSLRLGDAGGLSQFGVNLVMLEPGAMSSLRHYHMEQDEFVMVTQGVCTLIDDMGEHELGVGDCAAFPAGDENGHCFVNKTQEPAAFLVVGTRTPTETAFYSDINMMVKIGPEGANFTRKDGSPLTAAELGDDQ